MSGILGNTKNSSSRKSIVLIQIGTKSPSYPATAIGTIGTNSAKKSVFQLQRCSDSQLQTRRVGILPPPFAASPPAHPRYDIRPMEQPSRTRVGTRCQSYSRYDHRNTFTRRDTHQAQLQALSSYGSRPRGTPSPAPIGTRCQSCFRYNNRNTFTRRHSGQTRSQALSATAPVHSERPYIHLSEHAAKLLQIQPSEQGVEVISSPFWRR